MKMILVYFTQANRVGGSFTTPVLSHHRAYGSVPRRFILTLELSVTIQQRYQPHLVEPPFSKGLIHVAGPRIPPCASLVGR